MPAGVSSCPRCGAPLVVEGSWPAWCRACEWGLPDNDSGSEREQRRAERRYERALAYQRRLLHEDLRGEGLRGWAVILLALTVHMLTLLALAGAVLVWFVPTFLAARLVATLLLGGSAWQARPRLGQLGDHVVLRPADAPASFALLTDVAASVGARAPDLLAVTDEFAVWVTAVGVRRRRALGIGLPRWNSLTDQQRLAALAHAAAHDVNADVRSLLVVSTAIEALARWSAALRPLKMNRVRASGGPLAVADYVRLLVLLPLSAFVFMLARLLHRAASPVGQRAEYRADEIAATIAGTDAVIGELEQHFADESCRQAMLLAARANRSADIWARQREFLAAVPDGQRERWRRIAARQLFSSDARHPPTALRLEMLRERAPQSGSMTADPAGFAAMTAELFAYAPRISREFREDDPR